MLNWAAKYYPTVRILKTHELFHDALLLEIGSQRIDVRIFCTQPTIPCRRDAAYTYIRGAVYSDGSWKNGIETTCI
jgi:hypothetical protein